MLAHLFNRPTPLTRHVLFLRQLGDGGTFDERKKGQAYLNRKQFKVVDPQKTLLTTSRGELEASILWALTKFSKACCRGLASASSEILASWVYAGFADDDVDQQVAELFNS